MRTLLFLTTLILLHTNPLSAHGGGSCSCNKAPGAIAPPHGGLIEFTDNHYIIEAVADTEELSLWLYDHHLTPIATQKATIKAKATPPKRYGKAITMALKPYKDHYIADLDLSDNVYRYRLDVTVSIEGEEGKASFQVEE